MDTLAVIKELAYFVFAEGDERAKARAMLCLVYYHALHDDFYEVRAGALSIQHHSNQPTIQPNQTKPLSRTLLAPSYLYFLVPRLATCC